MRQGNLKTQRAILRLMMLTVLCWIVLLAIDNCRSPEREAPIEPEPALTVEVIQEPEEPETETQPENDNIPGMDTDKPAMVARYSGVSMTDEERRELAAVVYLEARNQPPEGQQAVAEVVLNRVISPDFPDTVHDVFHQGEETAIPQFSTVGHIESTEPPQAAYDAIDGALYGDSILPDDVVYFSRSGENDRVWGKIGEHVFCYEYEW